MDNEYNALKLDCVHVGKVFKSYSAMCNELGLIPAQGNSKVAQIKQLNRYFDWEKGSGYSLVVTKVYDMPKPRAIRSDDRYSLDILTCLQWDAQENAKINLNSLAEEKWSRTYSFEQILKLCGFVNERYSTNGGTAFQRIEEYCSLTDDLSVKQCTYYFNELNCHISTYCGNVLNRCLNRLKKNGYLEDWRYGYWVKRGKELRRADAVEENVLKRINDEVKKELEITYLNIYNQAKFYQEVSCRVVGELGCDGAYKLREVTLSLDDFTVSKSEYDEARDRINAVSLEVFRGQIDGDIKKGVERDTKRAWDEAMSNADEETLEAIELFEITPSELYGMLTFNQDERYNLVDAIKRDLIDWFVSLNRSRHAECVPPVAPL